jgi:MFS family permease
MSVFSTKIRGLLKVFSTFGMPFVLVWILNFTNTFVRSFVGPSIPYLVRGFVGTEVGSVEILGVIFSVESVAWILSNIPGGLLSDRIGRKKVIVLSSSTFLIAQLVYMFSMDWYWLVAASFIRGLAVGLAGPSFNAIVAELTKTKTRGTAYGVYNLSWTISNIPAPIIGGYLASQVGIRYPFLIAAILLSATFVLAFKIPDSKAERVKKHVTTKPKQVVERDIQPILSFKKIIAIFCGMSLLGTISEGMRRVLNASFLVFRLKVDPFQMGVASSLGWAIVSSAVMIPGGKLADRWSRKRMLFIGLLSMPFIVILSFSQSLSQYVLFWGLVTAFSSISIPASSALLMDLTPQDKRARTFGFNQTAVATGLALGPIIGGFLWTLFRPYVFPPFLFASLLILLKLPLILMLKD